MDVADQEKIERVRATIEGWALADLKRAASA